MTYLEQLTDAQRQAVTHVAGPLLVLAGPGSGKTRVVTCRVAHLLNEGIPAHQILALTFTNKAANEMRARLTHLAPGQPVWMSTFHRFCSQLLRRYAPLVGLSENFRIYDSEDSQKALKSVVEDRNLATKHYTPRQIAGVISQAKSELVTDETFVQAARRPIEQVTAEVYPAYQQRLMESNAVDFDDLLMHVAMLLTQNVDLRVELDELYRFILVDEYQDTNLAQYTIARALSITHPNLAVTGDPDQSIYAWRGADINNILEFERDYPHVVVVRLEQNYRSTKRILRVADQLISNNVLRKAKSLFTDNPEGQPVRLVRYEGGNEEAEDIARQISDAIRNDELRPKDVAILFRTNALTRNFEHALREYLVPYQVVNGVEFYQRKEIKDVLAYLHLINNPRDEIAFLRVINTPQRGIGKKSLQYLRDHARRHRLSLFEAARTARSIEGLTGRAAKALEKFVAMFDKLVLVAAEPVEAIVGRVLMDTGYRDHLKDSTAEEDQQRLANVEELVTAAKQFDDRFEEGAQLEEFLEQTSLVSDTDVWEAEDDKVTLMTLHAAKGLEFPAVYIVAVEQGILPHERSREDPKQLEEERRLLFVGITRAQHHLQLSVTHARHYRGQYRYSVPSPFLMELPREEMECFGTEPSLLPSQRAYERDRQANQLDEFAQEFAETEHLARAAADEFLLHSSMPDEAEDDPPAVNVMTAADMLGDQPERAAAADVSPDVFALGMLVTHPQLGPGKVIALSGRGPKRVGTIQFLQPPAQKKFCLAFSPLRPVRAPVD